MISDLFEKRLILRNLKLKILVLSIANRMSNTIFSHVYRMYASDSLLPIVTLRSLTSSKPIGIRLAFYSFENFTEAPILKFITFEWPSNLRFISN
jgi:hypothetical protein